MTAHISRISDAFRRNGIERILIVDDAYDPPAIDEDTTATLAEFFAHENGAHSEIPISTDVLQEAESAVRDGDTESDALAEVYSALYRKFTTTRDQNLDPDGHFQLRKGRALDELSPLHLLLRNFGQHTRVRTAGLVDGREAYSEFRPQIVFLDYYLDSSREAAGDRDDTSLGSARSRSLDFLRELVADASIDDIPAVVLISTQLVVDVDEYRHTIQGTAMMALRFGFLLKRTIQESEGTIEIEHEAAEVLLDTSQGYQLGKAIQGALHKWKIGTETAITAFVNEINDLQTKDFAYLLRFRLRDEAQPLYEYLVWLFGESLRGLIEESIDWDDSFRNLNPEIHASVEGALEGRTQTIAKIFHRARVNTDRIRSWRDYQLGDLFVRLEDHSVVVVITPDCDLVSRDSPPNAKRVLTMRGTLRRFDQANSAADDFLIVSDRPYSVLWDPKDLKTFPISGDGNLRQSHVFIGTLRPLYAQETQRRALADLSRIGLPVAPALGISATARVWFRKKGGDYHEIVNGPSVATVVPERSGRSGAHRALTARSFVHRLLDALAELQSDELNAADRNSLRMLLAQEGASKAYNVLLKDGARLSQKSFLGVGVIFGSEPRRGKDAPWLQIVIDVSTDALRDFHIEDPLR